MSVVFVHETNPDDDRNACWMALEIWRAFVRAGQGFSFVNSGNSQLDLSLHEASRYRNDGSGLIPDYIHDVTVRLLRGPTEAEGWESQLGADETFADPDYSLVVSSSYLVRGAWLMDFQLGDVSHESGNKLLEIKANFSINDYHMVTATAGAPIEELVITQ